MKKEDRGNQTKTKHSAASWQRPSTGAGGGDISHLCSHSGHGAWASPGSPSYWLLPAGVLMLSCPLSGMALGGRAMCSASQCLGRTTANLYRHMHMFHCLQGDGRLYATLYALAILRHMQHLRRKVATAAVSWGRMPPTLLSLAHCHFHDNQRGRLLPQSHTATWTKGRRKLVFELEQVPSPASVCLLGGSGRGSLGVGDLVVLLKCLI
jgi:hypothetical protein